MTSQSDQRPSPLADILLIADTENSAQAASWAIDVPSVKISSALCGQLTVERLSARPAPEAIWIEFSRFSDLQPDGWLSWVEEAVRRKRIPTIVVIPPEMIDAVDAQLGDTEATTLVTPDRAERMVALALALSGEPVPSVRDARRDRELLRLRRVSEELTRIARALSSPAIEPPAPMAGGLSDRSPGFAAEPPAPEAPSFPAAEEVRRVIRMRRMRDSYFQSELFADPAWDMLLDLFAATIEGEQVAVSSLCIAAAVPHTTALRWVKAMTADGIFERHADPADGRRVFIRLADSPTRAMAKYFQDVRRFESVSI